MPQLAEVDSRRAMGDRFVGRNRELERLLTLLGLAEDGRGAAACLVGEAGIGKTRLAEEIAARAASRGTRVLRGACFESDGTRPFGPWLQSLERYLRAVPPDRLVREMGAGAPALAALSSDLRGALPNLPPVAPLAAPEERARLHDAVTRWLSAVAADRPVLVVLEDLHWADRDTLGLLRHVARFVPRRRWFVLCTWRDPEIGLDRAAISELEGTLARDAGAQILSLRGLDEEEVRDYLALESGGDVPQALARTLLAETDGNPFYLRELFRHLVEERKIVAREGRWSSESSFGELGLPVGVRAVVARRLSRLSADTVAMLHDAAALVGEIDFNVLQGSTGFTDESLLACADEAAAAGLIRRGVRGRYHFSHALVRRTIYDRLDPWRRARAHRRIAESLERIGGDPGDIAFHFHASVDLPGAERGVDHALLAAERARAGAAHERAATLFAVARDLGRYLTAERRSQVLRGQALAEAEALLLERAARTTEDAWRALEEAGAPAAVVADFLAAVARALKAGGAPRGWWEPLVDRGLAMLGSERSAPWARLMLLRDRIEPVLSGPIHVGVCVPVDPEAIAVLCAQASEDDFASTLDTGWHRTRAETDEALGRVRSWRSPAARIAALNALGRDCFFRHQDYHAAISVMEEMLALCERYGSIPGEAGALVVIGCSQAALGELESARRTAIRLGEVAERLGSGHRYRVVAPTALRTVLGYLGGAEWPTVVGEPHRIVTDPETSRTAFGLVLSGLVILGLAMAGEGAESTRLLSAMVRAHESLPPLTADFGVSRDCAAAAVWELADPELARRYLRIAIESGREGVGGAPFSCRELSIARMAALAGDARRAHDGFMRAREAAEARGQRPVRALADFDEARWRLGRPPRERVRASDLLADAEAGFARLGMQTWVERVRAARGDRVHPGGLTGREAEVLGLLAAGRTNKEIASRLYLSLTTVQRHIANIYAKIGAHGRAEATGWAIRHGLARPPT